MVQCLEVQYLGCNRVVEVLCVVYLIVLKVTVVYLLDLDANYMYSMYLAQQV